MKPPDVSPQQLEAMLKRLHLACARRSYSELVEQAERGAWSFRDFLAALATAEIEHRRQTRLRRCVRQARFPVLHTLEEFDFSVQPELRPLLLGSAFAPEFAAQGGCLVLKGRSGRGKTHLATAIALPSHPARPRRPLRHRQRFGRDPLARGPATGTCATPWPPTSDRNSWSSTKSATWPTAPTPPTCSSMSSTSATAAVARWSSPPTSRWNAGGVSCTIPTSPKPSSTGSSNAAASLPLKDPPCAPATSTRCRVSLTRRLPHETSSQPFSGLLVGCARISGKTLPE